MKIATRFGSGILCAGIFLAAQAFGQSTYTTPEAQKAAAQLSQPAGASAASTADTTNVHSDRTTVPGYGVGSNGAADNRPVQPIYDNSAAIGNRPMPMRGAPANSSAMEQQNININNSVSGQQRGEIGVWMVENGGQGVRVARLARGGAAEQAGLKNGDIITQVNGNNVESPREASQQIRSMAIGQAANLTLMRDGSQQQLQVTLAAARPGQSYQVGYGGENGSSSSDRAMNGERDGNGLAARTARLEQQMESMTRELQEMRQQMSSMKTSGASSSGIGTEQPGAGLGTTSTTPSATTGSATPPQPAAGTATSSSSTTPSPTPAAGTSSAGSSTPSSTTSGSSGGSDDLFGTGSSTGSAGSSSPSGTSK